MFGTPQIPEFIPRTTPESSTSALATRQRQNTLLKRIARLAEHRPDLPVQLKDVDPRLKLSGKEFVTTGEDASELNASDLNRFLIKGYITYTDPAAKLGFGSNITHQLDYIPFRIWMTEEGIDAVVEVERTEKAEEDAKKTTAIIKEEEEPKRNLLSWLWHKQPVVLISIPIGLFLTAFDQWKSFISQVIIAAIILGVIINWVLSKRSRSKSVGVDTASIIPADSTKPTVYTPKITTSFFTIYFMLVIMGLVSIVLFICVVLTTFPQLPLKRVLSPWEVYVYFGPLFSVAGAGLLIRYMITIATYSDNIKPILRRTYWIGLFGFAILIFAFFGFVFFNPWGWFKPLPH